MCRVSNASGSRDAVNLHGSNSANFLMCLRHQARHQFPLHPVLVFVAELSHFHAEEPVLSCAKIFLIRESVDCRPYNWHHNSQQIRTHANTNCRTCFPPKQFGFCLCGSSLLNRNEELCLCPSDCSFKRDSATSVTISGTLCLNLYVH